MNEFDKVFVSIVIPVYNAEKYLKERMECLLKQSLKDIEIICVDDGSTDGSLAMLERYAKKDRRVKVITQQNLYAGIARNNGLAVSKGEYIIFMDADDFCAEDMLAKMYEKGKKNNADVVLCGGAKYNTAKKEIIAADYFLKHQLVEGKEVFNRNDIPEKIFTVTVPAPWNKLFKKKFIMKEGLQFQELQNSNDAFFTMSAMGLAERISYVSEVLCYYRIDSEGSIQKKKHKNALNFFFAYGAIFDKLVEKGIYEQVKKSYIDLTLSGIVFNVNTITDFESSEKIINYFAENFNEKTHVIDESLEYYSNKANYCRVKNLLNHYKFKQNRIKVSEDKQVHTLVENTTIEPMVSVIVPVYNVEEYLIECLDSLAKQTLKNIEIICINDGSKDDSLKLCLEYADKDKRVAVIDQLNSGLSMTRNVGVQKAKGKYVYFIDSDDYLLPQALEELVAKAEKEELEVLFFGADSFGDASCAEILKRYVKYYHRKGNYEGHFSGLELLEELLRNKEYRPSACMQLINREFFLKKSLFFSKGILHEDNIFTFKCLLSASSAGVINKAYYQRRIHSNSIMTENISFANTYGYFRCYLEMLDFVENNAFEKRYESVISSMLITACDNVRSTYKKMGTEDKLTYLALDGSERALFQSIIVDYMEENNSLCKERAKVRNKERELQKLEKLLSSTVDKNILEKQLKNSSLTGSSLEKENAALKKQLANQIAKYTAMENSVSFKIGRILTCVPRAIRNILLKK